MKLNASQIRAAVDKPDPRTRLYLLHGPDEAGAADLADRLARALGPDVERVDIEPRALRDQPGKLADEAAAFSLFGGARLIRIQPVDDGASEAIALLLAAEQAGNPVVAIGPGLKTTSKLVKTAIGSPVAAAFACYIPEGPEAARMATTIARDHGLRLLGDVPHRLIAATGGDRAVLTREIEKLALYLDASPEAPRDADNDALDAIGAALGEPELFATIATILDGRLDALGKELAALREGGGSLIPLLRQLVRRLMTLAEMRADLDQGGTIESVLEKHRVFFKEKAATGRALRRWSAPQIARAIDRLRETERNLMHSGSAGEVLAEAECTTIARAAARARG